VKLPDLLDQIEHLTRGSVCSTSASSDYETYLSQIDVRNAWRGKSFVLLACLFPAHVVCSARPSPFPHLRAYTPAPAPARMRADAHTCIDTHVQDEQCDAFNVIHYVVSLAPIFMPTAGEEHPYCASLIEAHKACLRVEGFNV